MTRFGCEVGVPKLILCDKQPSIERMLRESQIEVKDLHDHLVVESGIEYWVCPVSGHNFHGQVERCIMSIRDAMAVSGALMMVLHATGLRLK